MAINQCDRVVHEEVCVQATIRIIPICDIGVMKSHCVGEARIGACNGEIKDFCEFTVSQTICVEVPIVFGANAEATPNGIVCGTPEMGNCPTTPTDPQ